MPEHTGSEQVSCLSDGMFLKYLSVGSDIQDNKFYWKVELKSAFELCSARSEQRPMAANYFAKQTIADRLAFCGLNSLNLSY